MGYQLDFGVLAEYFSLLLHGVEITLGLTAISATLGLAFSIGGAATARWGPKWARALVMSYVELIRNTPFIVQLFFVFFGLPSLGLQLTALQPAILPITTNQTTHAIEIIQAGIEAGVKVRHGDLLGLVGDSGDASVCHLHFGISPPCLGAGDWWTRRGVVWPWPYLDAWQAGRQLSPVAEVAAWRTAPGCPTAPPPGLR